MQAVNGMNREMEEVQMSVSRRWVGKPVSPDRQLADLAYRGELRERTTATHNRQTRLEKRDASGPGRTAPLMQLRAYTCLIGPFRITGMRPTALVSNSVVLLLNRPPFVFPVRRRALRFLLCTTCLQFHGRSPSSFCRWSAAFILRTVVHTFRSTGSRC